MITLSQLNAMPAAGFAAALASIFEHSPWVPERAAAARPFRNGVELHAALCAAVIQADDAMQTALIRAHPELAGRIGIGALTEASGREQRGAGLNACSAAQHDRLQILNSQYGARFGIPFILAVRGHTPDSVIEALQRRINHDPPLERRTALHEIFRIARFRLADLVDEPLGDAIIGMAEALAQYSDDTTGLTCAYLTPSHRATAALIRDFMLAAGMQVSIDAVANVVGVLPGRSAGAKRLLTGSHYDTVINAGKFDGRLGFLLPIAVAGSLRRAGITLPYPLEVIAFAEEEGVRFKSTFLGSRALAGRFDETSLECTDASGITLRDALAQAGHDPALIASLARDPNDIAGFIEVHIEQGPVLLEAGVPVGVVSSIAGSVRSQVTVEGQAGHAGTVPMTLRRDAAAAAAEIVLAVESRCRADPDLVGTVGQLCVPGGAVNVIPGRCELSIDIRCGDDARRDAAQADVGAAIEQIAARRRVSIEIRRVLEAPSIACAAAAQRALAASIKRVTGQNARSLPSGAGHDAMMMASLTEVAMLFVRCGNGGISHHPLESLTAADADVAAQVFRDYLQHAVKVVP